MVDTNGTVDHGPMPDMSTGDKLEDARPFLATINVDQWEDGQYGWQWHFGIKALTFKVRGPTGLLWNFAKESHSKKSKCGILLTKCEQSFGKKIRIGRGDLVGKTAWFVREDIDFGKDKDSGEQRIVQLYLPLREATAEDIANAVLVEDDEPAGVPAAAPKAADLTDEDLDAIFEVIDGVEKGELQKAVMRSKLSPDQKNAILSDRVFDQGHAEIDGTGTIRRLVAVN